MPFDLKPVGIEVRNSLDRFYFGPFIALFLPAEPSENERAPNLRVMAGNVDIGAASQRTSKDNTVYHSVKLDDPSFSAPIYANLVAVDDGYALVWSR